jgi:hypothetical protein
MSAFVSVIHTYNIALIFICTTVASYDYTFFVHTVVEDSFRWIFMNLKPIRVAEIMTET